MELSTEFLSVAAGGGSTAGSLAVLLWRQVKRVLDRQEALVLVTQRGLIYQDAIAKLLANLAKHDISESEKNQRAELIITEMNSALNPAPTL